MKCLAFLLFLAFAYLVFAEQTPGEAEISAEAEQPSQDVSRKTKRGIYGYGGYGYGRGYGYPFYGGYNKGYGLYGGYGGYGGYYGGYYPYYSLGYHGFGGYGGYGGYGYGLYGW